MSIQAIDRFKATLERDPNQWDVYKSLADLFPEPARQAHVLLKGAWHALAIESYREAKDLSLAAQERDGTTFSDRLIDLELLKREGNESKIPDRLFRIAEIFKQKGLPAEELKACKMLARISADPLHYKKVIALYTGLKKPEKAARWEKDLAELEEISPRESSPAIHSDLSARDDYSYVLNEHIEDPPERPFDVKEVIGAIRWFSDGIVHLEFIDPDTKKVWPVRDKIRSFARKFVGFVSTSADGPTKIIKALQAKNLAGMTDAFLCALVRDKVISEEDIPNHVQDEVMILRMISDIQTFEDGQVHLRSINPLTKEVWREKVPLTIFVRRLRQFISESPGSLMRIIATLQTKNLPDLTEGFLTVLIRGKMISEEDIPNHIHRELRALRIISEIHGFEEGKVFLRSMNPDTREVHRMTIGIKAFAKNFEKLIRDNPTTKYKILAAIKSRSLPGLARAFFGALGI